MSEAWVVYSDHSLGDSTLPQRRATTTMAIASYPTEAATRLVSLLRIAQASQVSAIKCVDPRQKAASNKHYSFLNCKETLAPSAEVMDKPSSSFQGWSVSASTLSTSCIKRIVTYDAVFIANW
jgi:hypothetical protein